MGEMNGLARLPDAYAADVRGQEDLSASGKFCMKHRGELEFNAEDELDLHAGRTGTSARNTPNASPGT